LAWKGYGLWALFAQQATERIVAIIVLWIGSPWKPRFGCSVTCLKDLLRYTAPAVLARSTDFAVWQLDRAALGIVYPPEVLGAYVLARQVMTTINGVLLFPTTNVMFGFLSRLQGVALLQAVASMLHLMSLVMMPIFIGLSLVSADLVIVIFGSQWGASAAVLPVLVIAGIPYFLALLFLTVSRSRGAPGKWMWVSSTVFLTNMALIALLHPYGLVTVAMAFAVRDCLLIPFYLLMLRQLCGLQISDALRHMMMPAIGTSVMAIAVLCVRSALPGLANSIPNLVLSITTGVVVYVSVMAVLDRPILAKALAIGRSVRLRKRNGDDSRVGPNPLPQVAIGDRDAVP
jgi:O-antigen/teichoic acid export membrane protein